MKTGKYSCVFILMLHSFLYSSPCKGDGIEPGTPDDAEGLSRRPTAGEMMRSAGVGYISPSSARRECLGRLVFDVVGPAEWPTYIGKNPTHLFSSKFSESLYDSGDKINVENVSIAVIGPLSPAINARISSSKPWAEVEWNKDHIKRQTAYIDRLKKEKVQSESTQEEIRDSQELIARAQLGIQETLTTYENISLTLPDSEGIWRAQQSRDDWPRYSIYRIYLRRADFVYVFESTVELTKQITKEKHLERLLDLLKDFRPRKANEIPTDLGVCIPHGFIADKGERLIDIKQSMRWPDAPGVLYSVQTGNSTPKNTKAAFISAISTAMTARMKGGDGKKPTVTHQIGPRLAKIGGLPASQGGFAMRIGEQGKMPMEVYDVFTGYSGWLGTAVLPYISVGMSTRTIDQVSELKSNPPPFQQSMDRLEMLLRSTYIRSTTPLMPEFEKIHQEKR